MNTFQCVCTSTRLVYKLQYILKMPKDSTTHTRPWNHRHIYIHTNSKITVTYSKFLSFQHQLPYIRAPNAKNAQKIARTKKLSVIPDSATLFFRQAVCMHSLQKIHHLFPIPHFALSYV